jgi:hypothetical protein
MVAMLDDGDPQAYDFLPAMPDLSGEWADARADPDEAGVSAVRGLRTPMHGSRHRDRDAEGGASELFGAHVPGIADAWEAATSPITFRP